MFNKKRNLFKDVFVSIAFIIITLCVILYLPCTIYNFQPPKFFSGKYLYNPYQDSLANWQKTNFHAHSVAWDGFTNGKQQPQNIINAYKQKGYDYTCISNYEKIAKEDAQPSSVNVYEHGCNISKVHQLVIMPTRVCYTDFPLFQFASSKQFVLNKLKDDAEAVVLAHPNIKNGYSNEDLKKLSGYNLIEVLNHSVNSGNKWDVALSAGRPVWIIGDDDTHNLLDSYQTFTNWTMIDCHQQNKDSLIKNLICGNAYGVTGKNAFNDNKLVSVKVEDMRMFILVQNNADSIQFIGQNGIKRATFFNTNQESYKFTNSDTYIRTVIYTKASTMYLNPVIRYDGITTPHNLLTATINKYETALYRSVLITCWVILVLCLNFYSLKHAVELLLRGKHQPRNKFTYSSTNDFEA